MNWSRRPASTRTPSDPAASIVEHDLIWNGKRFVGTEPFFLARFETTAPRVVTTGMLANESPALRGYGWFGPAETTVLVRLQPVRLPEVVAALDPAGPWASYVDGLPS